MVGIAVFLFLAASASCADIDAEKYLSAFGYHNSHLFNSNITESLLLFQRTFKLDQSGILDDATMALMHTPRCGNHDNSLGSVKYYDTPWDHKALSYYYYNYSPDLPQGSQRTTIARALKFWSDVTPLTFTERQGGDINIAFGGYRHKDSHGPCRDPFDGPSKVLAHAYFPPTGRIHFDGSEKWTVNQQNGINLLWVATHEMGHIMGLEHDTVNKDAIMYPYYRAYTPNMRLHANDIRRIQRMYGKGGSGGGTGGGTHTGGGSCKDRVNNCARDLKCCNGCGQVWDDYMKGHCKKSCGFC